MSNKIIIFKEDVSRSLKGVVHLETFSKKSMANYLAQREDPNATFVEVELVPTGRTLTLD